MPESSAHYLLFTDTGASGWWHFSLESLTDQVSWDASDVEPDVHGERLELLAVVRGLEAIDEPARVTLITPSRYVSRGLRMGLASWRKQDWKWERHGWMVPVKNADLWQRLDRALEFHRIDCRQWKTDSHSPGDRGANVGRAPFEENPAFLGGNLFEERTVGDRVNDEEALFSVA